MIPYKLIPLPRAGWSMEPWWREEGGGKAFMKHRLLQEWTFDDHLKEAYSDLRSVNMTRL
ncbi:hypothetical protein JB92DRAFT_3032252 [Gautieria morchelliformis]|nr:hypothetical protein JB92DRAFT_3032252 [Gautieria morchelliformis]